MTNEATTYDQLPYPSGAITASHPARLATIARLRGLHAPSPETCRFLELGCSDGGNFLPLAAVYPDSTWLGIDLSPKQIETGKASIAELRLQNAELRTASLTDIDETWGEFDYIVCHGVFSWVPRVVQDKVLSICKENLSPQGVAYISFNTYPGWAMGGVLREMLLYHTRSLESIDDRLEKAREFVVFLSASLQKDESPFAQLMKNEIAHLPQMHPSYFFHEFLEEVNEPLYFHQFMERSQQHGLQYLGEANFASMLPTNFADDVAKRLQEVSSSMIDVEQYMDLLRNRPFRQTLLCHESIQLSTGLSPSIVKELFVASCALPHFPDASDTASDAKQFRGPDGFTLTTADPALQAALTFLNDRWPSTIAFADLVASLQQQSGVALPKEQVDALATHLLMCYGRGLIELHCNPRWVQANVTERPVASPWARWEARSSHQLTDLTHDTVQVADFDRLVLLQLDGRRDASSIAGQVATMIDEGKLKVEGGASAGKAREEALTLQVKQTLRGLARRALLLA